MYFRRAKPEDFRKLLVQGTIRLPFTEAIDLCKYTERK